MGEFTDLSRQHIAHSILPVAQGDGIWDEEPVSPTEFFEQFVNEPFFPIQQALVDAMLGTDPTAWDTRYTEGIALWGKGSGKDRTAAKLLTYVVYKLLCMKDPYRYFELGRGDKLEVGNVSMNARLAKDVFFKHFRLMVQQTINPKTGRNWFEEHGLDVQKDVLQREIRFPKNITAYSLDSEEYTGEGLNLFFVIFDELGGFDPAKAKELYTALKTTARSRFPHHMKVLLLSYKRHDNDFMMVRFKEAEKEPKTYRSKAATWDVNLNRKKEDFIDDFAKDPETAQRIYECEGSTSEGGYFTYKTRLAEVIQAGKKQNPIVGELYSVVNLRSIKFKDWFKPDPSSRYFIHVDLATGKDRANAAGLAMGHFKREMPVSLPPDFLEKVIKTEGADFSTVQGRKEVGVVVDLVLQIKAPQGGEILFEEIRSFIERLKTEQRFPIQLVSYDGWQSVGEIQLLKKAGIAAEVQSVDKNNEAYDTLKSLMYQGLFESYWHPTLIRELEELIVQPDGKVDHPAFSLRRSLEEDGVNKGSKDVSDSVAGCVNLCLKHVKPGFQFWVGGGGSQLAAAQALVKRRPRRYESEELVRHGEKPLSWYRWRGY